MAVIAARATPSIEVEVEKVRQIGTPRHRHTVYLPAAPVPPTVVTLYPERAETAARARGD